MTGPAYRNLARTERTSSKESRATSEPGAESEIARTAFRYTEAWLERMRASPKSESAVASFALAHTASARACSEMPALTRESRSPMRTYRGAPTARTRAPAREFVDTTHVERSPISFTSWRSRALKYSWAAVRTSRMSGASRAQLDSTRAKRRTALRRGLDRARILSAGRLDALGLVVEPSHVHEVDLLVELQPLVRAQVAPFADRIRGRPPSGHLRCLLARVQNVVVRELDSLDRGRSDHAVAGHDRLERESGREERVQRREPSLHVHAGVEEPRHRLVRDQIAGEEDLLLREIHDQVSRRVGRMPERDHLHRALGGTEGEALRDALHLWGDPEAAQGVAHLSRGPSQVVLEILGRALVDQESRAEGREVAVAPGVVPVAVGVHHGADRLRAGARPDGVREDPSAGLAESRVDDDDPVRGLHPSRPDVAQLGGVDARTDLLHLEGQGGIDGPRRVGRRRQSHMDDFRPHRRGHEQESQEGEQRPTEDAGQGHGRDSTACRW